jgi:hypothetical protein
VRTARLVDFRSQADIDVGARIVAQTSQIDHRIDAL